MLPCTPPRTQQQLLLPSADDSVACMMRVRYAQLCQRRVVGRAVRAAGALRIRYAPPWPLTPMAEDGRDLSDVLAENYALRAASSDLAVTVARLRAELATRATPAPAPPRGPPSLQETPVEVVAQILGCLDDVRDLFAVARSCRLGREASRTRGAFRHVFWDRADWNHEAARHGLFWPVRDGVAAGVRANSRDSRPLLAYLASCDAMAGIRSLALSRRLCRDATTSGVAAFVARCSALEALQISRRTKDRWSTQDVETILYAASATSVRRVLVPVMGVALDALTQFPCLESLALSHEACEGFGAGYKTLMDDVSPVEDLISELQLLRELSVSAYCERELPFAMRSATLERFGFNGRGLRFTVMECPRLTSVNVCASGCWYLSDCASFALALIRGCPLLQWRTPPIHELPELTDEAVRQEAKEAWATALALAQAQEDDLLLRQLVDDEDAVSFVIAVTWRPIVNGRLQ